MPYKAKKPCAYQGCPNLTGGRYCEEHAKLAAKQYNQYSRDPATNKRYGRSWARIRAAFLSANPLCERCKRDGRLTPAEMVHHKVRLTDGGTNDWNNLMALCTECHSRLHAEQGDYFT
jgi:5-methylcytosine-specific restriction protein A